MKYGTNLDLNQNELQNGVLHPLAVAPSSPTSGQIYYNTVANELQYWNGTTWISLTTSGGVTTASNGLTSVLGDIQLGGTLTHNTTVLGGGLYSLYFQGFTDFAIDSQYSIDINANNSYLFLTAGSDLVLSADIGGSGLSFSFYQIPQLVTNNGTDNTLIIYDGISNKGLVYTADYSPNFTNESLITKRYADKLTAISLNVIPVGTGTNIVNGTWKFATNDIYPITTGSNIGDATHRIGTIFMASVFDYATDINWFNGTSNTMTLTGTGRLGVGGTATDKLTVISEVNSDWNGIRTYSNNLAQYSNIGWGGMTSTYYLKLQSGSGQPLALNASGENVGIGTLTPTAKLHVLTNSTDYVQLKVGNSNGNYATGLELGTSVSNTPTIYKIGSSATGIASDYYNKMVFAYGGANNAITTDFVFALSDNLSIGSTFRVVNDGGNLNNGFSRTIFGVYGGVTNNSVGVGMGSAIPTSRLQIKGIDSTSSNYALKVDNSASSPILYARNNAVVGIGIASPTATLHVVDTQTPDSTRKVLSINDSIGTENLYVSRNVLLTNIAREEHYALTGTLNIGYFYGGAGNMFFQSSLYGANVLEIDVASHPIFKSPQFNDFYFDGSIGVGMTTPTAITSKLQVVGLLEYTDNADALANGLTAGAFYRTGDLLKVVH